jgi:hypothetical protein
MYDPKFLDELAREIAKRLAPLLNGKKDEGGGNGGGNGGGGAPAMKRLLTVKEAAAYLGLYKETEDGTKEESESAIYHLVSRRQIPVVRKGRTLKFDIKDLDRMIESQKASRSSRM